MSERTKTPETDRAWADCGNTDPLTAAQRMRDHAWRIESERNEAREGANHYQALYFAERKQLDSETWRAAGNYYRLRRMVRIALRYRLERNKAREEVSRLLAICTNVHDRLLRGDDDMDLLAMLAEAWKAREAGKG